MKWFFEIFIMECKRVLSYRIDFWLQFGVVVCTEIGIAYYLWSSIFESEGVTSISGMSFEQILIYYAVVPFIVRLVKSSDDFGISREIYEGGINKYIIYPVSYSATKMIERAAFSTMGILQMIVGLAFLSFFIPIRDYLTLENFVVTVAFCGVSFLLYFYMCFCLEILAFWFDSVWSLGVMLRFVTMFFGGGMIPLAMFPDTWQSVLSYTPFPYLFSMPMRIFLGQANFSEIFKGVIVTSIWVLPIAALSYFILNRGFRRYTGVGI